jgi:Flp pilus assembly pilin Flp
MENQDQVTNTTSVPQQSAQLPNSTGVLVLGILSIVFCWCWGIIGLILGIIAIVMAGKATQIYNNAPNTYSEASFKNVKAGKICAIIGICLSAVYFVFLIIYFVIIGAALTTMPWEAIINNM